MMCRRLIAFGLIVAAAAPLAAAELLRIVPLVRDDTVIVSVELADAYTQEVRDAIASGLRTTFTYQVDLRMIVPAWVDRTIATAVVTALDQYDNLTRLHTLSLMIDGRVQDVTVTDDESVVERWLTNLHRMPLFRASRLEPNRDYYVRIRASVRPRGASLLGWTGGVSGQTRFTFIP